MRTRTLIITLITIAVLAILAYFFLPRLLAPKRSAAPTTWPTQAWQTSTPEEAGLDSNRLAVGLKAIQKRNTPIDSLLVIRNGAVLLDANFYPHTGAAMHDLASVTKSFITTLIGIAIDQGKLKLDQPVLSFFPERTIANRDARKESMTVQDLVSMRNGFESGCIENDQATIQKMMKADDWVQAALDRRMTSEPGSEACYDSPGMHLLSAILQKATGVTALEFGKQNLFGPLGIEEVYWVADPQGITRGWGDLHLKPADAAKLGYLWLNNGVWDGKQVVSAEWVKDSVDYHSDFNAGDGYGYGWWLWEGGYGASGRGGQSVKVEPSLNVVVVTTGGGFDYDSEIDQHLVNSVVDLESALPANPQGVAKLDAVLKELAQAPDPQPVPPLPDIARTISGLTFVFEPNAANLASLRMEFNDTAEAISHQKFFGSDIIWSSPIGLDGLSRPNSQGEFQRGHWIDPQTFVLEITDIGTQDIQLFFEEDRVILKAPESGISLEGKAASP